MSIERELLRRISSHSESRIPAHFIYEIQELLAQPEQRLAPLTSKLILHRLIESIYIKSLGNNCHGAFIKGVRFAEKMHGIRGVE